MVRRSAPRTSTSRPGVAGLTSVDQVAGYAFDSTVVKPTWGGVMPGHQVMVDRPKPAFRQPCLTFSASQSESGRMSAQASSTRSFTAGVAIQRPTGYVFPVPTSRQRSISSLGWSAG